MLQRATIRRPQRQVGHQILRPTAVTTVHSINVILALRNSLINIGDKSIESSTNMGQPSRHEQNLPY